ncbi:MAG: hypothetical protein ABSA78_13505 [Candidatus Sulfotelmatobacter sp.]|jgi:hypothetical protein
MNVNIDFGILVVILLFIGNEVSQVKRKLSELDEKLGHFQIENKQVAENLSADLDLLRDRVVSDIKHEIQMHEIRTSS